MLRPSWWSEDRAVRAPSEPDPDIDADWVDTTPPPDPARIAAAIMIGEALERTGTTVETAARDGNVIFIQSPDASWTAPIHEQWSVWIRGGEAAWDLSGVSAFRGGGAFSSFAPAQQPRDGELARLAQRFQLALAAGEQCLGVAHDRTWMPDDLVDAVDLELRCLPLNDDELSEVVQVMTGVAPTERLDPGVASTVTPRQLRLCRRVSQEADGYMRKLAQLVKVEAARKRNTVPTSCSSAPRAVPGLERLHGMEEAVAWGFALARDLVDYRAGRIRWEDVDCGLLLYGPPGTGKTLFAQALAATCGVPLVVGSYGQWIGTGTGHQGDLIRAMRATFAEAGKKAPAILFIDEVDSFPDRAKTSRNDDWNTGVGNALLTELDGVGGRPGVVVIGACNHPQKLDPALVRSGRLDRRIRIALPGPEALALILREHLGSDLADVDLSRAAALAIGSSGADCERHVRGVRRRARTERRPPVLADLLAEIGGATPGEAELHRIAVHEAGHAVVGAVLAPGRIRAAAIRDATESSGAVMSTPEAKVIDRAWIRDAIMRWLSGRAAEELVLGEAAAGAGGGPDCDLAHATLLATHSIVCLGLHAPDDLLWLGMPETRELREMLQADPALADRVRGILRQAYADVLALLARHRQAVEAVAVELARDRSMTGERIVELVTASQPVVEAGCGP